MARKLTELTKDELIAKIADLEDKLRKRYGLVWDREKEPEQIVVDCERNVPVLQADKTKTIVNSGEDNILIEGDNYHALTCLNYTHQGKVDLIYIDPPYNTGAEDWKYNNNYVDKNDNFRHSKWLNMMEKRLLLAKRLLSETGVLICAIDENEQAPLGLLLQQIFNNMETHCITIVHNPRGVQGTNFSYTHEYAYFVIPQNKKSIGNRQIPKEEIKYSNLRNWGAESERTDAKNCFYPIIVEDGKVVGFGDVLKDDEHPKKQTESHGHQSWVYPMDIHGIERKWRYARQTVETIKHLLRAKKTKSGYEIEIGKDFGTYRTVWQDPRYDANEKGTKLINSIVPNAPFNFPKSLWNVYDCLYAAIGNKTDAVVVDFFAGSGTTGHAVLEMNKDGGHRRFILCTNNEGNICTDVCYPRLKGVINGYKEGGKGQFVAGLGGNLTYYKTALIPVERIDKVTDRQRVEITQKAGTMIGLKESTLQETELTEYYQIFTNHDKTRKTAIYFREDESKMNELIKKLADAPTALYVFSYSKVDKEAYKELGKNIRVEDIPEPLLQIYKEINLKIEDK